MNRAYGEATQHTDTSSREEAELSYDPPQVAWEEEFEPVAASCDPANPECLPTPGSAGV